MLKTFAYTTSLLLLMSCSLSRLSAQDTIPIPLKIRIGLDVSGPVKYYIDKNVLNTEGFVTVDLNEKRSVLFAAGYLDYKYKQYNYSYLSKGLYVRTGMDFNLLNPDKSQGKYWVGIGLHYGLSRFKSETPLFLQENYWGLASSSLPLKTSWGHFIEATPGVRAEIFKNFSMGWSINVRMLLHTSGGKELRPVYFPGFGNSTKTFSSSMAYYISWNIPYKRINAIIKKEEPEETEETNNPATTGSGQQGTGIRQ
jgi:hypothetical protein